MNRFNGFTQKANIALNLAIEAAQDLGHTYIGTEHIVLGLLREGTGLAATALNTHGVEAPEYEQRILDVEPAGQPTRLSPNDFTPRSKKTLELAVVEAAHLRSGYVGTEHILLAVFRDASSVAMRLLVSMNVRLEDVIRDIHPSGGSSHGSSVFDKQPTTSTRADSNSKTPTLDQYGRDLTKMALEGKIDPVIGRTKEIDRVIQVLSRRTKNNPCLIGEPGVGKTAIAEGLARKIALDEVPELLRKKRVIALDLTGMVAGTKYRGDFEERIKNAMDEVVKSGDVVLFVDEVHTIIGVGAAEGAVDAANILKPSLARGELQIIGATTVEEYRRHIEKDAALERRFQPIMIGEPSQDEAIRILFGLRDKYEAHHKVKITDEAISAAVILSSRYITDRFLPDKAIDLIDEAASKVRLKAFTPPADIRMVEERLKRVVEEKRSAVNEQDFERAAVLRDEEKELTAELDEWTSHFQEARTGVSGQVVQEDIAQIVSEWVGIPVTQLTEEESARLLKMEEVLHKRLVGQEDAVVAVSRAIRRGRVGLKDPKRPIGSFIFLGPTGVGKTELCKALAETMFGDENAMIRLDMSEFMEKHAVSKLVGSPPGYVGYDEGGQLTEKIRRKPYSVVLFDEIEKAHPDVFNMLLQILDDGVLTDSQGRRVDFKNTIIIMTSNIGARRMTEQTVSFGFGVASSETTADTHVREQVLSDLRRLFKPEFLNRVDDIIVFSKLTQSQIEEIALRMLSSLKTRMESMGMSVHVSDEAIKAIAKAGFDPVYGARPLRRAIQSEIEDALAERILDGTVKSGECVCVEFVDDKFVFQSACM